jgi:hypothetical protein
MNNIPHVPTRITTKDKDYQNIVNILNDVREHTYKEYAVPYKEVSLLMYETLKALDNWFDAMEAYLPAHGATLQQIKYAITEYDNKIGGKYD